MKKAKNKLTLILLRYQIKKLRIYVKQIQIVLHLNTHSDYLLYQNLINL